MDDDKAHAFLLLKYGTLDNALDDWLDFSTESFFTPEHSKLLNDHFGGLFSNL